MINKQHQKVGKIGSVSINRKEQSMYEKCKEILWLVLRKMRLEKLAWVIRKDLIKGWIVKDNNVQLVDIIIFIIILL